MNGHLPSLNRWRAFDDLKPFWQRIYGNERASKKARNSNTTCNDSPRFIILGGIMTFSSMYSCHPTNTNSNLPKRRIDRLSLQKSGVLISPKLQCHEHHNDRGDKQEDANNFQLLHFLHPGWLFNGSPWRMEENKCDDREGSDWEVDIETPSPGNILRESSSSYGPITVATPNVDTRIPMSTESQNWHVSNLITVVLSQNLLARFL